MTDTIPPTTNELIYIRNTINEYGERIATILQSKGYEVEFGKKSEGKNDLSDLLDIMIMIIENQEGE